MKGERERERERESERPGSLTSSLNLQEEEEREGELVDHVVVEPICDAMRGGYTAFLKIASPR